MIKLARKMVTAWLLLMAAGGAFATSVSPGGTGSVGTLTDLGSFAAGTYQITGSGVVDLVGNGSFLMQPNGVPVSTVTASGYSYFNPSGSFLADGNPGQAGPSVLIGALIGTLTATPSAYSDWFLIGYSTVITLASAGHIYASVNDTYHQNNTGAFNATVVAVPEPGTWALMLSGLAMLGLAARRRLRG